MAVRYPSSMQHRPCRRTATSVMAGAFDDPPLRDVLTSLLNGVGPYKGVERDLMERLQRKKEKKEAHRERKRQRLEAHEREQVLSLANGSTSVPVASTSSIIAPTPKKSGPSSFWAARPSIHIATMQRSVSVTPPPVASPPLLPSTPGSTPGPSISSSTSYSSSKRPRTPEDDETLDIKPMVVRPPRKRKAPTRKGWKGWVEGSPPPSEKLINLDAVPTLRERRTRSGKNFDAIGIGKDSWV